MPLFRRKFAPAACRVSVPLLVSVPLTLTVALVPLRVKAQPPAQSKDLVRADAALSAVQKRVALVIGNKDYENNPLKNPVNDANAMAAELKDLGFEVILKTNLTNEQMDEALDAFASKLGPNTIGLFYFSGHGVQVEGANYLVPIGYAFKRQSDVKYHAFAAQQLLDTMGQTGCRCNIVILDACRNNPLPKGIRSAGNEGDGLGKMNAPSGTFIAYATAPGQTASDESDKNNGLYTGVLLQKMRTPGLKIEDVFKATLVSVAEASGEKQVPWVESSLRNDFYFAAGIPNPRPQPAPAPVVTNGEVVDLTARLILSGLPSGARVEIDGRKIAGSEYVMDLPRETNKEVTVLVEADGFRPLSRKVTLKRGTPVSLPLTMVAVAPIPIPAPKPAPVPPAVRPNGGGTVGKTKPKTIPPPVRPRVGGGTTAGRTNPKDGAELIYIPAGPFEMGDDQQKGNKRRTVTLSGYYIYKNLVTVGMYEKFCKATKRKLPPAPDFNKGWSKKDHPIVNVSWIDAKAYCTWVGTVLPSETQWEKAARGTDGRLFPWGDRFGDTFGVKEIDDMDSTARVGSFPAGASPYGVLDMAGSVHQWCEDWYGPSKKEKALRGGVWHFDNSLDYRCFSRGNCAPSLRDYTFGFRCVVSSGLP